MTIIPFLLGAFEVATSLQATLTCDSCHRTLVGAYYTDEWGHRLCVSHHEQPRCDACGAVLAKKSEGYAPFPLCPSCAPKSLATPPAAAGMLARTQKDLRSLGLPWWPQTFPLRIVSQRELLQAAGTHLTLEPLGMARGQFMQNAPPGTPRKVEEILVVPGLHEIRLGAVLAHELGHAWLWQQNFLELPDLLNEGFPELCAHRWLGSRSEPFARMLQRRMEQSDDPIYGRGFRTVQQAFQKEPTLARARELMRHQASL